MVVSFRLLRLYYKLFTGNFPGALSRCSVLQYSLQSYCFIFLKNFTVTVNSKFPPTLIYSKGECFHPFHTMRTSTTIIPLPKAMHTAMYAIVVLVILLGARKSDAFRPVSVTERRRVHLSSSTTNGSSSSSQAGTGDGDNKAMQFLKKIGKVGGAANRDFRYALGVDEGPSGKSAGGGLHVSCSQ
jgi:hypothetical protein